MRPYWGILIVMVMLTACGGSAEQEPVDQGELENLRKINSELTQQLENNQAALNNLQEENQNLSNRIKNIRAETGIISDQKERDAKLARKHTADAFTHVFSKLGDIGYRGWVLEDTGSFIMLIPPDMTRFERQKGRTLINDYLSDNINIHVEFGVVNDLSDYKRHPDYDEQTVQINDENAKIVTVSTGEGFEKAVYFNSVRGTRTGLNMVVSYKRFNDELNALNIINSVAFT